MFEVVDVDGWTVLPRWLAAGVTISCRTSHPSSSWRDCEFHAYHLSVSWLLKVTDSTTTVWFSSRVFSWLASRLAICFRRWQHACQPPRVPGRAMRKSRHSPRAMKVISRQRAEMSRGRATRRPMWSQLPRQCWLIQRERKAYRTRWASDVFSVLFFNPGAALAFGPCCLFGVGAHLLGAEQMVVGTQKATRTAWCASG